MDSDPAPSYTIDPDTGAATAVGLTGFEECNGMDFNASGALFATCERADAIDIYGTGFGGTKKVFETKRRAGG